MKLKISMTGETIEVSEREAKDLLRMGVATLVTPRPKKTSRNSESPKEEKEDNKEGTTE